MTSSRPFEGLRVLDLTHVLAGPFCTYLLALLGAETIKIEPPNEPDEVRGRGVDPGLNALLMGTNYLAQGANKKAITLDLKSEVGQTIFKTLATTADVIVENYRTGALASLGLGYDEIRKLQPKVVYCSMTGFGQTGDRAEVNAYDNVIQAASGLMSVTGTPEVHPLKTGAAIIDYASGLNAAFAIAAALVRRERTGEGVYIDCAMMETALLLMGSQVTAASMTQQAPVLRGNNQREAGLGCYETADGLLMLGAFNKRQHERLWLGFGRPDLAAWSSWEEMAVHAPEMREDLTRLLRERPATDWEHYFHERGIPAERVRTTAEALKIADTDERPFTTSLEGLKEAAQVRVPSMPFRYSSGGPEVTSLPPRMGEHTREVLRSVGYEDDAIDQFEKDGTI